MINNLLMPYNNAYKNHRSGLSFGYSKEVNAKLLAANSKKTKEKNISNLINITNKTEDDLKDYEQEKAFKNPAHKYIAESILYKGLCDLLANKALILISAQKEHPKINFVAEEFISYYKEKQEEEAKDNPNPYTVKRLDFLTKLCSGISYIMDPDLQEARSRQKTNTDVNLTPASTPVNIQTQEEGKTTWNNSITGMSELKGKLWDDFLRPALFFDPAYDLEKPQGILLYGPPGCGKTYLAKKMQKLMDGGFVDLNISNILDKYVGETPKKIDALFAEVKEIAQEKGSCILFIDEADSLLVDAGKTDTIHAQVTNKFKQEVEKLDGTNVFLVYATNNKGRLDKAMLRTGRLSGTYYVDLPEKETRKSLLKYTLQKLSSANGLAQDEQALDRLAEKSEGLANSDIVKAGGIIDLAAKKARTANEKITENLINEILETDGKKLKKDRTKTREEYRGFSIDN